MSVPHDDRSRVTARLGRRVARQRALPPAIAGVAVLAGTGAAVGWVHSTVAAATPPTPQRPAASAAASQVAADAAALRAVARTLTADNQLIAEMARAIDARAAAGVAARATGGAGGAGVAGGAAALPGLPPLPSMPAVNIPAAPAVQAVTGASAVVH